MKALTRHPFIIAAAQVGLGFGYSGGLWAQDEPPPTPAACEAMIQALQTTPLPAVTDSAWVRVAYCTGAGSAIATAIGSLASSPDTALMDRVVLTARGFTDGDVFNAFKALAANSSATARARSTGFYGMLVEHLPVVELDQRISTVLPPGQICAFSTFPVAPVIGAPRPVEYVNRIASTARTVLASGASSSVKAAANCAYSFVHAFAPAVSPGQLTLAYVCGNTFSVNNAGDDPKDLTYTVDGSTERATIPVPAHKSTTFTVASAGRVRLYFGNFQFASKENLGTSCPP